MVVEVFAVDLFGTFSRPEELTTKTSGRSHPLRLRRRHHHHHYYHHPRTYAPSPRFLREKEIFTALQAHFTHAHARIHSPPNQTPFRPPLLTSDLNKKNANNKKTANR